MGELREDVRRGGEEKDGGGVLVLGKEVGGLRVMEEM